MLFRDVIKPSIAPITVSFLIRASMLPSVKKLVAIIVYNFMMEIRK